MKRGRAAGHRSRPICCLIVLGIALIAAACGDAPAEPVRPEIVPDFSGEVQAVIQSTRGSFGPTTLSP